jgi:hypothetical protein
MFQIKILNTETKKTFTKEFTSYFLYEKFMKKLKYSKKLVLISTSKF